MEEELINSIKNNEFIIYLQPKFNTIDEKILGDEALIRKNVDGKIIMQNRKMIDINEREIMKKFKKIAKRLCK